MHWRKVTLVGVGLLGGSLGLALRRRHLVDQVHGYVRRPASIDECLEKEAVDVAGTDLEEAVRGADLVVLCTPIAQMRPLVDQLLPALSRDALVTDVGSVKGLVVEQLESVIAGVGAHFIGSHPMAGSERMGVKEAREDLFVGARCVITPTDHSDPVRTEHLRSLWSDVGGVPMVLSPDRHDELVSRSSHLPHVVASELAGRVLDPTHPREQAELCANGFRDATRIASGSPEMWRDICLANREHLEREIGGFIEGLKRFQELLSRGQEKEIDRFFAEAKKRRDRWNHPATSSTPE